MTNEMSGKNRRVNLMDQKVWMKGSSRISVIKAYEPMRIRNKKSI